MGKLSLPKLGLRGKTKRGVLDGLFLFKVECLTQHCVYRG